MLISETGAAPQAGKARAVRDLVAGVARYHLTGFVWFDIDQSGHGLGKADWSLDSDPAAVAAFRSAATTLSAEKQTAEPSSSPARHVAVDLTATAERSLFRSGWRLWR